MGVPLNLTDIQSGFLSATAFNQNNTLTEAALAKTLNRTSNAVDNAMEVDLDMGLNKIFNVSTDVTDSGSLITVGDADGRYVNVSGDAMQGDLAMGSNSLTVKQATLASEPIRKDTYDAKVSTLESRDNSIETNYQNADANLQSQISNTAPLEASAFSEISWHDQIVSNSVTIPDNKNAWSSGPTMTVDAAATVTIGTGSFWTIANGAVA